MRRRKFIRSTSVLAVGIAGLAGCTAPEAGPEDGAGTETTGDGTTEMGTETGAMDGQQARSYRLGGRVEAWLGQEPQSIADEANPTLQLTAGEDYEVTWENLDGQPHDFAIQDADGNTLESTEQMSEEGATRTLSFTATEEMAQYICTVHPTTMKGEIQLAGG